MLTWKTGLLTAVVVAIGAAVVRWQLAGRFVEEPKYELERALAPGVELRRYAPRVLAATTVRAASQEAAANEGFRRIGGYIFGANTTRASIAMTAPVTQATDGARIAMTVPVTQTADGDGPWEITFTMPAGSTLASLPAPTDARVSLRELPAERYAVLRYSGTTPPEVVRARTVELREAVSAAGIETEGEPVSARYDPPSTLPFLRRNEVWLRVR